MRQQVLVELEVRIVTLVDVHAESRLHVLGYGDLCGGPAHGAEDLDLAAIQDVEDHTDEVAFGGQPVGAEEQALLAQILDVPVAVRGAAHKRGGDAPDGSLEAAFF